MSSNVREMREQIRELRREIAEVRAELTGVLSLMQASMGLMRRLSGDENVDATIRKIQELITILNGLRIAYLSFEAATGPMGQIMAGIGLVSTIIAARDFALES